MLRVLHHLIGRRATKPGRRHGPASGQIERLLEQSQRLDIGALIRLSRAYAELAKPDAVDRPGPIVEAGPLAMELARPVRRAELATHLRGRVRRLVWDTWWVEDGPEMASEQRDREAAVDAISYAAWAWLLEDVLPPSLLEQLREPWRMAMGADPPGLERPGPDSRPDPA